MRHSVNLIYSTKNNVKGNHGLEWSPTILSIIYLVQMGFYTLCKFFLTELIFPFRTITENGSLCESHNTTIKHPFHLLTKRNFSKCVHNANYDMTNLRLYVLHASLLGTFRENKFMVLCICTFYLSLYIWKT